MPYKEKYHNVFKTIVIASSDGPFSSSGDCKAKFSARLLAL
jgi:hypothetical protein